jgi:protein-tyrosine phosphatase
MVDIHCHILPQVDDGAKSWEISLEMCRVAAADGIDHIVATPHSNERYAYDRAALADQLAQLSQRAQVPSFSLGCDFHFSYENLQNALAEPHSFAIGETCYMLVELSNWSVPPQIRDHFVRVSEAGIVPVLTHPERNPVLQKDPLRVLEFVELGAVVQVTASSFTGDWGETALKAAYWLLQHDAVHVLATDAHDDARRPPVLSAGAQEAAKVCGEEIAHALVEENPRAIISGQSLPFFPRPVHRS